MAQSITEGILMGLYTYTELKTEDNTNYPLDELTFVHPNNRLERAIQEGIIIGTNVNIARDLCNKPGNHLTPKQFAQLSKEMAKNTGLKSTILGEKEMEVEKMGALLFCLKR
jgi:leucyl aminopeptidase